MSKNVNELSLGLKLSPKNKSNEDADVLSKDMQYYLRFMQDTEQRRWLVIWMMWIIGAWLALTLFIVMFNKLLCFNISDSVLTVLLATTTANVLGLPLIVLKDLFWRGSGNKRRDKEQSRKS